MTWADLVDQLAAELGGLAALARHLLDIAPEALALSPDPLTIERGLRRLRRRAHAEPNKYGLLLLRGLGIPRPFAAWAKDLGQYHSRCSDLPLDRRRDQLRLWNCPPTSASRSAIWIHLGLATIANDRGDAETRDHHLQIAEDQARHAEAAARTELALFQAVVAFDRGDRAAAAGELDRAEAGLEDLPDPDERADYQARLLDQRAYQLARGWREDPQRLTLALAVYDQIPIGPEAPPFAAFRREHGRAWCLWRRGDEEAALDASRSAARHAGDGGLLRFRGMALALQMDILGPGPAAEAIAARLRRMSRDPIGES